LHSKCDTVKRERKNKLHSNCDFQRRDREQIELENVIYSEERERTSRKARKPAM
jgi:hypothetical protein